jgi:hypothetical protein
MAFEMSGCEQGSGVNGSEKKRIEYPKLAIGDTVTFVGWAGELTGTVSRLVTPTSAVLLLDKKSAALSGKATAVAAGSAATRVARGVDVWTK